MVRLLLLALLCQEGEWSRPPMAADGTARFAEPCSREDGALEFEFAFTLSEEEPTSWALTLEHPDGPREVPLLQVRVDFDPVGGAVWTAAVRDAQHRARSFVLEEPPEPEGLRHHLRLRLPAEGGVDLRFADGHPLLVTSLGTLSKARLTLQCGGPVTELRMRGPEHPTSPVPAELVRRSRADGRARPGGEPFRRADQDPAWGTAFPDDLAGLLAFTPPEPAEVRDIEPVIHEGLTILRRVLTFRPRVEIPVLQLEPKGTHEGSAPGVLLLPPRLGAGKLDASTLELAARLAARGCRVLVPDELAQGERLEFQPHDGPHHRELQLVGGRLAGLVLEEAWGFLDVLQQADPDAPLVVIGADGTRETVLWLAALRDGLAGLVAPPAAPPALSLVTMPPDLGRSRLAVSALPFAEHQVLESLDAEAILTHASNLLGLSASAGSEPGPPDAETLTFGPLQVGSLWYSWILDEALRRLEERPAATRPVRDRIEELLRMADLSASTGGDLGGIRVDFDGSPTGSRLDPPDTLVPSLVTLILGEVGKVEAVDRVAKVLPPRDGERWISLDIDRVGPGLGDCYEWTVGTAWEGTPLLGRLLKQHALELRIRAEEKNGGPVRLVGQGVGGLLALLLAVLEPESVESVVLVECMPSLSMLLDGDPRTWTTEPAGALRSQAPSSLWYAPDLLATLDLEDLVLALMDQGVDVRMERPVDRQLRPLSRRDLNAMWPRVLHRRWKDSPVSSDEGPPEDG